MLNLTCTNEQKVKVTANPQTEGGRPAPIDGQLNVEVVSGEGTFEAIDGEANSFYAVSGDGVGVTEYRVFADADLGEGVVTIEDLVTLTVGGAQARSFGLSAETPVQK
jgi:hypothetical protein